MITLQTERGPSKRDPFSSQLAFRSHETVFLAVLLQPVVAAACRTTTCHAEISWATSPAEASADELLRGIENLLDLQQPLVTAPCVLAAFFQPVSAEALQSGMRDRAGKPVVAAFRVCLELLLARLLLQRFQGRLAVQYTPLSN